MTFAGPIIEFKGSTQYIRKRTFIEIISSIKYSSITTFVLKDTFSSEVKSGTTRWPIQKIFLSSSR